MNGPSHSPIADCEILQAPNEGQRPSSAAHPLGLNYPVDLDPSVPPWNLADIFQDRGLQRGPRFEFPTPPPSRLRSDASSYLFHLSTVDRAEVLTEDAVADALLGLSDSYMFASDFKFKPAFARFVANRLMAANPRTPFDWAHVGVRTVLSAGAFEHGISSIYALGHLFESLGAHFGNLPPQQRLEPIRVNRSPEVETALKPLPAKRPRPLPEVLYFASQFPATPRPQLERLNTLVQRGCLVERVLEWRVMSGDLAMILDTLERIYIHHEESRHRMPWWFHHDIPFAELARDFDLDVMDRCSRHCGPAFEHALAAYHEGGSDFLELNHGGIVPTQLWNAYSKVVFAHGIANPRRVVRVLSYIRERVERSPAKDASSLFEDLVKHAENYRPQTPVLGVLEGEAAALPFPGLSGVFEVLNPPHADLDRTQCDHNPRASHWAALQAFLAGMARLRQTYLEGSLGVSQIPSDSTPANDDVDDGPLNETTLLRRLLTFYDGHSYYWPAAFHAYWAKFAMFETDPFKPESFYVLQNLYQARFPDIEPLSLGCDTEARLWEDQRNCERREDYLNALAVLRWLARTGVVGEHPLWYLGDRIGNHRDVLGAVRRYVLLAILGAQGRLPPLVLESLNNRMHDFVPLLGRGGPNDGAVFRAMQEGWGLDGDHLNVLGDFGTYPLGLVQALWDMPFSPPDSSSTVPFAITDLAHAERTAHGIRILVYDPIDGCENKESHFYDQACLALAGVSAPNPSPVERARLFVARIAHFNDALTAQGGINAVVNGRFLAPGADLPPPPPSGLTIASAFLYFCHPFRPDYFSGILRENDEITRFLRECEVADRRLAPIGCKVHFGCGQTPPRPVLGFLERLGTTQTGFASIHAGATLNFPALPSSFALTFLITQLASIWPEFDPTRAEYQFCLPGRLPPQEAAFLGAVMHLSSRLRIFYPNNAFKTNQNDLTGARCMLYDAGGPRTDDLPGVPPHPGRTDILGRKDLEDARTFQVLGTILLHASISPGPFGNLAAPFREDVTALLRGHDLEWVLDAPWILDPLRSGSTHQLRGDADQHMQAVRACVNAAHDEGLIHPMRALLANLMHEVEAIQVQLDLAAENGLL